MPDADALPEAGSRAAAGRSRRALATAACYAFLTPTAARAATGGGRLYPPQPRQQPRERFRPGRPRAPPSGSSIRLACALRPAGQHRGRHAVAGATARPSWAWSDSPPIPTPTTCSTSPGAPSVIDSVRRPRRPAGRHLPRGRGRHSSAPRPGSRGIPRERAARRSAALGARRDRRRRRRGGGAWSPRPARDRVLPGQADRVLAGELPHLSRLQSGGPTGQYRRAAPRSSATRSPLAARAFRPDVAGAWPGAGAGLDRRRAGPGTDAVAGGFRRAAARVREDGEIPPPD